MSEPTTTQVNSFRLHLEHLERLASATTNRGRTVRLVCAELVEHDGAMEDILIAATAALGDHATLRRVRNAGHEAGFDEGYNAALQTSPEEETS